MNHLKSVTVIVDIITGPLTEATVGADAWKMQLCNLWCTAENNSMICLPCYNL
jgi:hypothetical protein